MKKYLFVFLLFVVSPACAQWQTPNHSVPVGRGVGVTGFGSVGPCALGIPVVGAGAILDPSCGQVGNAGIAPGPANTMKGTLNGTATSDITITACTLAYQFTQWVSGTGWQCGVNPVLPSRAITATLNLSAFTAITTQGYTTPGDGGGATFVNVGTAAFKDTYISGLPTITTAGSGLTNGTYLGTPFGGGVGTGCSGSAVVSGNAVTSISIAVPCPGYKVGDVLTIPTAFLGGSGVAPTFTVTAISTPQASFTDTAGDRWQFIPDQAGYANILQFGGKGDWNGTDGSATNNSVAAWSADAWASYQVGASLAQVNGNLVLWPRGAYMTCGGWNSTIYDIPISQGVRFAGVGVGGTSLIECAADSNGNHYIELCDSNAQFGQYGCKIESMTLYSGQITTSTAGIAEIYSNSGQQFSLVENVEIQPGLRSCVKYEIGKGGAANDIYLGVDCEQKQGATNPGFSLNSSSTQHYILHSTIGCAGTGCTTGISHLNGRLIVDGLDMENYATGLLQNVTTTGSNSVYRNVQQNSNNCTQAVTLLSGNVAGNILFENVATACPTTITNGQSGGTNFTGNIRGPTMCVSGACGAAVP